MESPNRGNRTSKTGRKFELNNKVKLSLLNQTPLSHAGTIRPNPKHFKCQHCMGVSLQLYVPAILFLYHLPATGTHYTQHSANISWVVNMEIRCPAEKRATALEPGRRTRSLAPYCSHRHIYCQLQVQLSTGCDLYRKINQ